MTRPYRLPSLDGLRAVAIGLVLAYHAAIAASAQHVGTDWLLDALTFVQLGELGVRTFFVISGFLITGILLRERERTGRIRLGHFYWRRTLRIFPAYYVFLGVVVLLALLHLVRLNPGNLTHALTYTVNYDPNRAWVLGHGWSLSVEEQFYLLWPALLVLLGAAWALRLVGVYLVLAPLGWVWWYHHLTPYGRAHYQFGHTFETAAGALAAGCLMAGYRHELWAWAPYRRLVSSRWVLLAVVAATAGGLTPGRPNLKLGVGYSLMNLGLAVLVERCVRFPENRIGKLLNAAPLVWVGAISYSLYLWQEVFLDPDVTAWWAHWPASLGLTVAAAYLSYRFVERPILAWRDRKTSRKPPVPPGAPLILGQPVE